MEYADISRTLHGPRHRQLLHQALHPVHAGVCADDLECRRPRPRHVAHGTRRRRDFGRTDTRLIAPFPQAGLLLFGLAAGFGVSIALFATSRSFPLSLVFLFIAGGFQTTFLSAVATLLQFHTSEHNRGRIMSMFGLINRGLGPMGSFPFGLIATWIGAPWTVAICGALTIGLVGYVVNFRTSLRDAKAVGES